MVSFKLLKSCVECDCPLIFVKNKAHFELRDLKTVETALKTVEDCLKTDKYCDWFLNDAEYWSYRCCIVSFKLLKSCVEVTDIYHTD